MGSRSIDSAEMDSVSTRRDIYWTGDRKATEITFSPKGNSSMDYIMVLTDSAVNALYNQLADVINERERESRDMTDSNTQTDWQKDIALREANGITVLQAEKELAGYQGATVPQDDSCPRCHGKGIVHRNHTKYTMPCPECHRTLSERIAPALNRMSLPVPLTIDSDDLRAIIAFAIGTGRNSELYRKDMETSEIIDGILKDSIWEK